MKRLIQGVLSLYLIFCAAYAQNFKTFPNDPIKVKQVVLKNGLTVMLSENHDVGQVFGAVVVRAGGKNDPKTATGIAHYLEHMLFKGTEDLGTTNWKNEKPLQERINALYEDLSKATGEDQRKAIQAEINEISVQAGQYAIPNELDRMLSSIGSTGVNAFTTEDMTVYHNTFPSNQIEKWLDLYAHRFDKPVFRLFQSELETVYEEKNRSLDNTIWQVFETFNKEFYKNHPYGQQTVLGSVEHLKNPSLQKMYEFYNTWYVANNMALILSGDFNSEQILPLIEKYFGTWRQGTLPEQPVYDKDSVAYRKLVKVKMTPVKVGVIGYHTVPFGDPDYAALEVANNLLSNESGAGFLDKLKQEGKVLDCGLQPMNYNERGGTLVYFIPKIIGQKLEEAERQVRYRIEKMKNGEFDESLLDAVKMNLIGKTQQLWESNEDRVMEMSDCFSQGRSWGDYIRYEEEIQNVTKSDIMQVADRYYNRNFLVLHSKMGFPKKEKLEKPGYTPITNSNEEKSDFRKKWEKVSSSPASPKYVNLEKDITKTDLALGCTMKSVKNPFNNLFTLEIRMGKGNVKDPVLEYVASYLDYVGTPAQDAAKMREALYKTGCSLNFRSTDEAFIIELSGLESGMDEAFRIMSAFVKNPSVDNKAANKVAHQVKTERKLERREPAFIAGALQEYALYGKNSKYLRQLGDKKISALNGKDMVKHFRALWDTEMEVHYVGKKNAEDVKLLFTQMFEFPAVKYPKTKTVVFDPVLPKSNTVMLVERENAAQTQIYFNSVGKLLDLEDEALVRGFNKYFGGDMSGVVFQQIREYRSLAYSTWANYKTSPVAGKYNLFTAYVGCQGDKTLEAMKEMESLIRTMPLYHERMDAIKSALIETSQSAHPAFRDMITTVDRWIEKGWTRDPNAILVTDYYPTLDFGKIVNFYQKEIAKQPMTITVVGDPKRFDKYKLMNFGNLIFVKEKSLFAK